MKNNKISLLILTLVFIISACKHDEPKPNLTEYDKLNKFVYDLMLNKNKIYYWIDEVPHNEPKIGQKPNEYLNSIRHKLDKWSVIVNKETFTKYIEKGSSQGFGISLKTDTKGDYRVSFVVENSSADKAGIKRGYKLIAVNSVETKDDKFSEEIKKINNRNNTKGTFRFQSPSGEIKDFKLNKTEITEKAVIHQEIIKQDNDLIGYIVFNTFIETGKEQLNETFATFGNAGINKLIIDLRYNPGGETSVAKHFASLICGQTKKGEILGKVNHNQYNTKYNKTITIQKLSDSQNIEDVIFICSALTASASELMINGLKPIINVTTIGEKSYGKPNGMYAIPYLDFTVLPVSFEIKNKEGIGGYYNGIEPDLEVKESLDKEFGDKEENCLKAALNYIKNGNIPATKNKSSLRKSIFIDENKIRQTFPLIYKYQ